MEKILAELAESAKKRPLKIKQQKEQGKKIIEYTGDFVPEELIYAADAEPYLMLRGGEPEPPEAVLEYMLRFMNPLARSMEGYEMLGLDPVTPMADLIATQITDCHVGRIAELMEFMKLPVYKVGVPNDWKKEIAKDYYHRSLEKFKDKLEEVIGREIDDADLANYIEKNNKIYALLREIDATRKNASPQISGYDFIRLNHYTFFIHPDTVIAKLEELLDKVQAEDGLGADKPRLLIAGRAIAIGDYTVMKLLESSGAVVVTEMMDEGIRPFKWDVATEGDLLANICQSRYIEKTPPTIFQPAWEDRLDYLKGLIAEYKVDGVVWYQLSFDEIYDMECSCLAQEFAALKVPFLKLESSYEYSREATGPLTTRIESFIASVKEGK